MMSRAIFGAIVLLLSAVATSAAAQETPHEGWEPAPSFQMQRIWGVVRGGGGEFYGATAIELSGDRHAIISHFRSDILSDSLWRCVEHFDADFQPTGTDCYVIGWPGF